MWLYYCTTKNLMIMEKVLQYVLLYAYSASLSLTVCAQTINCRPAPSLARSGGLGHTSCQASDACLTDHQTELEKTRCQQLYNHTSTNPLNITQCPTSGGGVLRHCDAVTEHNVTESQYFLVEDLSASVLSLDPHHFAINVSWDHRFRLHALRKPRPGRRLVGYEVRLFRHDDDSSTEHILCWCVWETDVSSVILGLDHSLSYRPSASGSYEVRFLSLPYAIPKSAYMPNPFRAVWPSGCNSPGIIHTISQRPIYGKPQSVKVVSNTLPGDSKELEISWSHPTTPPPILAPPPSIYYVYGISREHNFTVLANGTRNVVISHLQPTSDYIIHVQAYVDCSGLSAYLTGTGQEVGCGVLSEPVQELDTPSPILKADTDSASIVVTSPHTLPAAVTDGSSGEIPWRRPVLLTALAVLVQNILVIHF